MHLNCNLLNDFFDLLCFNKLIASNKRFDVNYYYSVEMISANFDRNLTRLKMRFEQ